MELRVEDLRKSYGGAAVLQGVSFTAEIGLTRVTGSSGIGKTTLLRILLGLERADGGTTNADEPAKPAAAKEAAKPATGNLAATGDDAALMAAALGIAGATAATAVAAARRRNR